MTEEELRIKIEEIIYYSRKTVKCRHTGEIREITDEWHASLEIINLIKQYEQRRKE